VEGRRSSDLQGPPSSSHQTVTKILLYHDDSRAKIVTSIVWLLSTLDSRVRGISLDGMVEYDDRRMMISHTLLSQEYVLYVLRTGVLASRVDYFLTFP
jgi:hypothetical protein